MFIIIVIVVIWY